MIAHNPTHESARAHSGCGGEATPVFPCIVPCPCFGLLSHSRSQRLCRHGNKATAQVGRHGASALSPDPDGVDVGAGGEWAKTDGSHAPRCLGASPPLPCVPGSCGLSGWVSLCARSLPLPLHTNRAAAADSSKPAHNTHTHNGEKRKRETNRGGACGSPLLETNSLPGPVAQWQWIRRIRRDWLTG
jgi:hypothetical protein